MQKKKIMKGKRNGAKGSYINFQHAAEDARGIRSMQRMKRLRRRRQTKEEIRKYGSNES